MIVGSWLRIRISNPWEGEIVEEMCGLREYWSSIDTRMSKDCRKESYGAVVFDLNPIRNDKGQKWETYKFCWFCNIWYYLLQESKIFHLTWMKKLIFFNFEPILYYFEWYSVHTGLSIGRSWSSGQRVSSNC